MPAAGCKGHAGGSVGSRDPEVQDMAGKNSPPAGRDHVNEERTQGVVMEAADRSAEVYLRLRTVRERQLCEMRSA